MAETAADDVLCKLIGRRPESQASALLTLVGQRAGATKIALFRTAHDVADPQLFVSLQIDQKAIARVNAAWADSKLASALRHLVTYSCHDYTIAPLLGGLLYMSAPFQINGTALATVLASTRRALELTMTVESSDEMDSGIREWMTERSDHEVARAKFIIDAERVDWNIAALARLLHCSRSTVYSRMKTFHIPIPEERGGR